jgi:hypothetical protein
VKPGKLARMLKDGQKDRVYLTHIVWNWAIPLEPDKVAPRRNEPYCPCAFAVPIQ